MRQITVSGRFEDACEHQGFCPAPYLSKAMQAKHCAEGCCPDCGRIFAEEHPQTVKKMADELATWRVYLEDCE